MRRALFVASTVAAAAAAMTSSVTAQCITGGTGGLIPATGTGDGTWSGTLPTSPMIGTLTVPPVAPGSRLNSIKLHGVSHTWIGDVQFVRRQLPRHGVGSNLSNSAAIRATTVDQSPGDS